MTTQIHTLLEALDSYAAALEAARASRSSKAAKQAAAEVWENLLVIRPQINLSHQLIIPRERVDAMATALGEAWFEEDGETGHKIEGAQSALQWLLGSRSDIEGIKA
ncbi:hypothetical protein [Magnetococcus sp. PR-3]|uniref:hypothetical protein n=1 Tax=Magnetococcus sp. PR-3 TaxID=3120355 RepID=UPI002FCE11BF